MSWGAAGLLFLLGCGTTGKSAHKPAHELSADKRDVITAFRAGGDEWDRMRDSVRQQPELAGFVVDNMIDQMMRSYKRAQMSTEIQKVGPFERAQEELVELSEFSIPVLAELLEADVSDSVVSFLAADTLRLIGQEAQPMVASKLGSENSETRRRSLALLAESEFASPPGSKEERALFARFRELALLDPEWIVRAEACSTIAIRGARQADTREAREVLVQVLLDEDDDVRLSAERALGTLGDPRSFPALINVLAREVERGSPKNMAGTRLSLYELARDPSLQGRARSLTLEDWRNYWRNERKRLLKAPTHGEKL